MGLQLRVDIKTGFDLFTAILLRRKSMSSSRVKVHLN